MKTTNNDVNYRDLIPKNGFVFKYKKIGNQFVHTFVEGEFITRMITPVDMVVGHTLFDFLPEDRAAYKAKFYEQAWNGETVNYEGVIDTVYYVASLNPIIENNKVVEVIGTAIDITDEKRNVDKTQELEKLAVVGELAAGIAHEIRNPLTSLMGFTQVLKERVMDVEVHNYLGIMMEELDRINQIINEFMFIAKPGDSMNIGSHSIGPILKNVAKLMQSQALLKGLSIKVDIQGDVTAECDSNLIKQVLINLVQNGIDASSKDNDPISISLTDQSDDTYLIKITDHGAGISSDRLKRLYEPFYTTKEKGTGLGLMICRRIIELHKGSIDFKSSPDSGTEVTLVLLKKL